MPSLHQTIPHPVKVRSYSMSDTQPSRHERRQAIGLFIGLVAFVLLLALPTPSGRKKKPGA